MKALRLACEPEVTPTLSPDELEAILDDNLRAISWAPNTLLKVGQVVYPLTRNGRRYLVTRAGTSTETEPTWSTFGSVTITGGAILEDGGYEYPNIYDINSAIEAAWLKKAAKASRFMATGGMNMSIIHENCLRMAEQYRMPLVG